MKFIIALLLLFVTCTPAPEREMTPEEMVLAHFEADEDFEPKSSEEWVAWANAMLPPEQPAGAGMRGSPTKGDVFLLDMQDRSREIARALAVKTTKPEEWPAYQKQPAYIWLVAEVKRHVANYDEFMKRLRLTNNPSRSIPESKRIMAQFQEFIDG